MAGNRVQTDIVFNMDDTAVISGLTRLDAALGKINNGLTGFGTKTIVLNQALGIFAQVKDAIEGLFNAAAEGAMQKDALAEFDTQMGKMGLTANQGLKRLSEATRGAIDNVTMAQAANKAAVSGLDLDTIATTMEYVSKYARSVGGNAGELANTVITGLTRGSTLFLDDVGIIISQTDIVNQKTKEWGRSLTPLEQKQVIVAEALKQMNEKMGDFDAIVDSQSEKIQRLITKLHNWKNAILEATADLIVPSNNVTPVMELKQTMAQIRQLQNMIKSGVNTPHGMGGLLGKSLEADNRDLAKLKAKLPALQIAARNYTDKMLRSVSEGSKTFLAGIEEPMKYNQSILDEAKVESATAGLSDYQKALKKINDTYASMPKDNAYLKKQADDYKRTAIDNLNKNTIYADAAKKAEDQRKQNAREVASTLLQLERQLVDAQVNIDSIGLSQYQADRLKAQAEFDDMRQKGEKLHSRQVQDKAKEIYDKKIEYIRKQEEEQAKADSAESFGKKLDADLAAKWDAYDQRLKALEGQGDRVTNNIDLKNQADNTNMDTMLKVAGVDEYGKALHALDLQRQEYFGSGKYDDKSIEYWYNAQKAALDYSVVLGDVAQNLAGTALSTKDLKGAFDAMEAPMSDFLSTFAQTGKMDFSGLAKGLLKSLQIYAAEKTAHLLMEAAYSSIMAMAAATNPERAWMATWYSQDAQQYLAGASIMGSFVTGSGLAGMAHDGMDYIPKEGTWLLDGGERIVPGSQNRDLTTFLSNYSSQTGVTVGAININGGDGDSIVKALPALKKALLQAVGENIASGGHLKSTIQTYAR